MFKRIAPIPVAVALLFAAAPFIGQVGATAIANRHAVAAARTPAAAAAKQVVHRVVLKTGMAGGKMVFMDAKGAVNPTLHAKVGDTIEVTVASGEGAEHDFVIPEQNVQSPKFNAQTGPQKFSFQVTQAGQFAYFCSIPGHRQMGMEGVLDVTGPANAAGAQPTLTPVVARPAAVMGASAAALPPAATNAADIVQDPTAVPRAIHRAPTLVKYSIETVELEGKLDDGTTFTYWTFNRKVPGPMLRVRQGDTVELTLSNNAKSKAIHSIDLHAVTGGAGGGANTQVAPGQSKTITFKALHPGLFVYHCATPSVAHHISSGMYGLILVEPPEGLPKVDREFYVMQGDLYTTHPIGTKGHQEFSDERMADEMPTYYLFNGAVGALTKQHKLHAKVGETVRVYFGVGGPNKVSSFHAIGEIFDKVYREGSTSDVAKSVQTTLVPAGGATIVDFKLQVPGTYMLVDHALSRVAKGAGAALEVTGPHDDGIYKPSDAMDAAMAH